MICSQRWLISWLAINYCNILTRPSYCIIIPSVSQKFISDKMNQLQLLVLEVLHHRVLPKLRMTRNEEVDASFRAVLRKSVELLRNDLSWLKTFSVKHTFCWGILAAYCSKITFSNDLDWTRHYFISKDLNLGLVFTAYCTWKQLPNDQRIITTKLPDEIIYKSEDLQTYV